MCLNGQRPAGLQDCRRNLACFSFRETESLVGGGSPFDRRSGTANRRRWACEKLLACGGRGWKCERDAGLTCYCGAPWIEVRGSGALFLW
jgi:hypothetical protein